MGKPLDSKTRNAIVRCLFHRCNKQEIADYLHVTFSTVRRIESNLLTYGSPTKPDDLNPKGRPDVISEEAEEALMQRYFIEEGAHTPGQAIDTPSGPNDARRKSGRVTGSQKDMVKYLQDQWGIKVSQATVSRLMKRKKEGKKGNRKRGSDAANYFASLSSPVQGQGTNMMESPAGGRLGDANGDSEMIEAGRQNADGWNGTTTEIQDGEEDDDDDGNPSGRGHNDDANGICVDPLIERQQQAYAQQGRRHEAPAPPPLAQQAHITRSADPSSSGMDSGNIPNGLEQLKQAALEAS